MSAEQGDFEIIQAEVEHVPLVAPLFDAYRQFYHQSSDLDVATAYLTERLRRAESVIFLALRQADALSAPQPVGFTQLYPSYSSIDMRSVWILYDLYVAQEARRMGVGRALLEWARSFAAASGAAEMSLQTATDNLQAQVLYASAGWKRDDEYLTYLLRL